LDEASAFVECGPMRLVIQGWMAGVPRADRCMAAAEKAITFLDQIASSHHLCAQPAWTVPEPGRKSPLLRAMWESTRAIGDHDLTPMAAVAGTIADAVADELSREGMTRVIVNNGGDIALRMGPGESIVIGIRSDVNRQDLSGTVYLDWTMGVGGACTSGLGGRSLTRGVASAVTVLADTASYADAAATAIANATLVQSDAVQRAKASSLDPLTDLNELEVTTQVGQLTDDEVSRALQQGIVRADQLLAGRMFFGAVITVQGRTRCTPSIDPIIRYDFTSAKCS